MSVDITVSGLQELVEALGVLGNEQAILAVLSKPLDTLAAAGWTHSKMIAPVDTGFLRDNIMLEKISDSEIVIVSTAPYSLFVEYGHLTSSGSFVMGRFYMTDTKNYIIAVAEEAGFLEQIRVEISAALGLH